MNDISCDSKNCSHKEIDCGNNLSLPEIIDCPRTNTSILLKFVEILIKNSKKGSVLRKESELENKVNFLMRNRDIVGLSKDSISRYPGFEFKLELEPDCPKVLYTQQYKQPRIHQENIKKWREKQLKEGLIEPLVSPFSSPLLVVPKKDGPQVRVCVDFRLVNRHSTSDRFPIPDIRDTINSLGKIFSTLDIKEGFQHV